MVDLHRHDEGSTFDGFGKAQDLAELAKELGHTSLGISNHGNTSTLVQTYEACKEVGIKPILGLEGYFLPKFKEKTRGYHICLFIKNLKGYGNLNRIMFEAEKHKYYNGIITLKELRKYHEGLICTSACLAGYMSKNIKEGKMSNVISYIKFMKETFDDDFYIEIQPYKVSDDRLQEDVNIQLIKLAKEYNVKCILTSDSHRGRKSDLDSYVKMHEIAKHNIQDIVTTYKHRYMPTENELIKRFIKMHEQDYGDKIKNMALRMIKNLEEIEDKVEDRILDNLELKLPKFSKDDSFKLLEKKVYKGLQRRNVWKKKYKARCDEELDVIRQLGFSDYFLIVEDYVNYAKNKGIIVGPGRGSVCNSLVAYALNITDVDSIYHDLDFRRFLRLDKKKMPDIDLDFETKARDEIIQYLLKKYEGQACQIASYGLYKVDNLVNDLAKVCGLNTIGYDFVKQPEMKPIIEERKLIIADIKKRINKRVIEGKLHVDELMADKEIQKYDRLYDDIITHFVKLFKKLKYFGKHAAGVAIVGSDILDYVALRIVKDKDENEYFVANYDLTDLEKINVIKFDILGLKTMEQIGELRKATGTKEFDDAWYTDEKILEAFRNGLTDGVFQYERPQAKAMLNGISTDCFEDIVAVNAMNRPGPLSLKMPEMYAENKQDSTDAKGSVYWKYTKKTYGTIIYQEQIQSICVNIGGMSWGDSDRVMKLLKGGYVKEEDVKKFHKEKGGLLKMFCDGAKLKGISKAEATNLFEKMLVYSFNKGHAVGYSLISLEMMYYKVYHPVEYWASLLKHVDMVVIKSYEVAAVKDGCVILPAHINGTADYEVVEWGGGKCIQRGLNQVKGIGKKAAADIEANGPYLDKIDFEEKVTRRIVNKRVFDVLSSINAFETNDKKRLKEIKKLNVSLKNSTLKIR